MEKSEKSGLFQKPWSLVVLKSLKVTSSMNKLPLFFLRTWERLSHLCFYVEPFPGSSTGKYMNQRHMLWCLAPRGMVSPAELSCKAYSEYMVLIKASCLDLFIYLSLLMEIVCGEKLYIYCRLRSSQKAIVSANPIICFPYI